MKFDESKHSVITKHMIEKNHTFNQQNVKIMELIMDYETNYFKRLISKMIHIKTQDNGLEFSG